MSDASVTDFIHKETPRDSEAQSNMTMAYDEKDDFSSIKKKLMARKKAIYGGLGFLAVVIIAVTIGVTTTGGSEANNKSGIVSVFFTFSFSFIRKCSN